MQIVSTIFRLTTSKFMAFTISFLISTRNLQVPPRFELGSLDSESKVLTITPWDLNHPYLVAYGSNSIVKSVCRASLSSQSIDNSILGRRASLSSQSIDNSILGRRTHRGIVAQRLKRLSCKQEIPSSNLGGAYLLMMLNKVSNNHACNVYLILLVILLGYGFMNSYCKSNP